MSEAIFFKLLALFIVVALGWVAGRMRWLGQAEGGTDPARLLSNAAFYIFVPALLFRTTARLDLLHLPWRAVFAFFAPVLAVLGLVYAWQRHAGGASDLPAAAPSVRAISATFGNTVQIGIPVAAALFGEAGLAIHVAIVGLHALTLLTVLTVLVELDIVRERQERGHTGTRLLTTLGRTARNTIIHPVILPVLFGLGWNLAGLAIPAVADEALQMLGQAVVPLCLVLIGLSLAYYGIQGAARGAVMSSVLKLVALPALVFATAHGLFGLSGLPLAVLVMMAGLPVGSNALIFAQRYDALKGEVSAAIVLSTLAYVATASGWLALLAWVG